MSDVQILVAVPCYNLEMHSYTASSLFSLGSLLRDKSIHHGILTPSGYPLPMVRNHIASEFLDLGYSHLMSIDGDVQFAPESVLTLLDMGVEFAAAPYRLKTTSEVLMSFKECEESTTDDVTEVDFIGMGFTLLSRSVFEKLNKTAKQIYGMGHKKQYDYYSYEIDPVENMMTTEDVAFCRRWRKIGGKVWMNRTIKLGHYGGLSYMVE